MDLQPHPVAEAVAEVLAVPGVGDHPASRGVDVGQVRSGPQRIAAGLLRGADQLIDLALPIGGLAQHKRPGHVGVIAADQGTEVDLDEVAGGQHRIGGPVMRDRRIRPAGHDRLERDAVGAVVEHQGFQFAAHLAFGPAGPQPAAGHQIGQRGVGGLAGQPQQRHLAGVLDFPQRFDRLRGADQLGGSRPALLL